MIDSIFAQMPKSFLQGTVVNPVNYYFSLGEVKKTVRLKPDGCIVDDGKTVDTADCVCKTTPEFFTRIWVDGYLPGMKDFLSGTIKSNDPAMLKQFLHCFGKSS